MDKKYALRLAIEVTVLAVAGAALFYRFYSLPQPLPAAAGSPATWYTYYRQGKALFGARKYRAAESAQKAALALNPQAYKPYIELGCVYLETGDIIKAIGMFKKAEALVGEDRANREVIYFNLGLAYALEEQPVFAWQYLRMAYTVQAGAVGRDSWKGQLNALYPLVAAEDFPGFLKAMKEEESILPASVAGRLNAIERTISFRKYDKAAVECRDYLADNPGSAFSFWFLRQMVESLNARRLYRQSLQEIGLFEAERPDIAAAGKPGILRSRTLALDKQYPQAFATLAGLQPRQDYDDWTAGQIKDLLAQIVKATKANIDITAWKAAAFPARLDQQLWSLLAGQYYDAMDFERAAHFAQKALESSRQDPAAGNPPFDLYSLAATISEENGDLAHAQELWREFVRRYPRGFTTGQARLRLMQLDMRRGDYAAAFLDLKRSQIGVIVLLSYLLGIVVFSAFFILGLFILAQVFFKQKLYDVRVSGIYEELDLFKFLLYLFSLLAFLPVGFLALSYYWQPFFDKTGLNPVMSSSLFMDVLLVAFAMHILRRKYRLGPGELGFVSRGPLYDALMPLAVVLGTLVFFAFVGMLYEKLGTHMPSSGWKDVMQTEFMKKNNAGQIYWLFMGLVVVGPIAEELLFRVFLFNFINRYSNHFWAAGLSATMFALCHQQLMMFPFFFSLGLILSFMYVKTRSIVGCMVTHALYNFTIFLVVFNYLT